MTSRQPDTTPFVPRLSAGPRVALAYWRHPRLGIDRWTIEHQGRAVLTFATEDEARQAAARHGWSVENAD